MLSNIHYNKDTDCWEWCGPYTHNGYGVSKGQRTHRIFYEKYIEPLGDLWCLHSCDNPCCVNPFHLWAGTVKDNAIDSAQKGRHRNNKKTHCALGHPYSGDNLRYDKRGFRICKKCKNIAQNKNRAKARGLKINQIIIDGILESE